MREISKEEFKKSIIENVKNQYRRTIDEATPQQIFQAVSYAIKDVIIDDWIATRSSLTRQRKEGILPFYGVSDGTCAW